MISKTLPKILEKILMFLILFTLIYGYFLYKKNKENYKKSIGIEKKILVKKVTPLILDRIDFLKKIETLFNKIQLEDFQVNKKNITLVFKGKEEDLKRFWSNILVKEDFWLMSTFYMNKNCLRLTFEQGRNNKISNDINWDEIWFGKKNDIWKFHQLDLVTVFVDNGEQIAVLRYPNRELVTVKKGDKIHDCQIAELNFHKIKCQDGRELR